MNRFISQQTKKFENYKAFIIINNNFPLSSFFLSIFYYFLNSKFNICINLKIKYLSLHFDNFPNKLMTNNVRDKKLKNIFLTEKNVYFYFSKRQWRDNWFYSIMSWIIFHKQLFDSVLHRSQFLSLPRIVKPVCFFLSNDLSKVGSRVLSGYSLVYPINDSRIDHSGETQLSSLRIVPMAQNAF